MFRSMPEVHYQLDPIPVRRVGTPTFELHDGVEVEVTVLLEPEPTRDWLRGLNVEEHCITKEPPHSLASFAVRPRRIIFTCPEDYIGQAIEVIDGRINEANATYANQVIPRLEKMLGACQRFAVPEQA